MATGNGLRGKKLDRPKLGRRTVAATVLVRQGKALDLRATGEGYDAIGKKLGVSGKTAYYDVQAAAAKYDGEIRKNATRYIEIEMRGLEHQRLLLNKAMAKAGTDPQKLAAVSNALTRIQERMSKLLGWDAAQRVEVSGPDGEPVRVVTYDGTPTEDLLARVEQLRQALVNGPGDVPGLARNDDPGSARGLLPADAESAYAAVLAKRVGGNGSGQNGGGS